MISLLADSIRGNYYAVQESKYFSFILNCTPDPSHTEQMSLTIRFVQMEPEIAIKEHFTLFLPVTV